MSVNLPPPETDQQARTRLLMDYPQEIRFLLRDLYETYRALGRDPPGAYDATLRDYHGPVPLDRSRWQGKRPEYVHACAECGTLFIGAKHAEICGDPACARMRSKRKRKPWPLTPRPESPCAVCRELFTPRQRGQAVCRNRACRERHYRRNSRFAPKEKDPDA